MYRLEVWRQAEDFLASKRISKKLNNFLIDEIEKLAMDPQIGDSLVGDLKGYFSLHLKYREVKYRVFYYVSEEKGQVTICYIGTRGEVYEKFKKLVANK